MEEISPGIYWLQGRGVNLFLCVEEDELTLVDAGMPGQQQMVLTAVQQLGYTPTNLKHILVTHADLDHVGSLAAIQAATGATIYAGQQTADLLVAGQSPQHMPTVVQFFLNHIWRAKPIPANTLNIIQDGEELPLLGGIQVLATPGHTLDHHSFYCRQSGILFAGDALNTRNGRISCTPERITADQDAATQSALRLLNLAPVLFACGHGRPISNHTSDDLMIVLNTLRQL